MAQDPNAQLGDEYFQKGDYEKALIYYDKFLKQNKDPRPIYDHYYNSLISLRDYPRAEKSLKSFRKDYPLEWAYTIDLFLIYRDQGKKKDAEKLKEDLFKDVLPNQLFTETSARHMIERKEYDLSEELFLGSRKAIGEPTMYSQNLIALYQFSGQKLKMIDEGISLLLYAPGYLKYVENQFQSYLEDESVSAHLESRIISRIQKDPESLVFSKLLVWFYVQKKDFRSAIVQAKSIDKRLDLQGKELMDLGEIIFENRAYEEAIELYGYVAKVYSASGIYPEAKRREITAREELAKSVFPVDTIQIRLVLKEYESYVNRIGKKRGSAEAYRRMALLNAFQMGDYDLAIRQLEEALLVPRTPRNFPGQCKLDMGDIYLLREEPWESKILYAQVEKSYKDQPLGHEGKFRLAKVYYFSGEFDLAKANLDILKRATTRQIANDAMDLSLLIQDNSALDTSYAALTEFARIDLLYFSQDYMRAKEGFEEFLARYSKHSLTDETYYKLALIQQKMGNYDGAIDYLDMIIAEYAHDILMDDALYLKGRLLEEELDRRDDAMDTYKLILFDYPGSFYAEDARRRYRQLRGDAIN